MSSAAASDRREKLQTEARTPLLVPASRLEQLLLCLRFSPDRLDHRPEISRLMRSRTSSQGLPGLSPESALVARRSISAAHAASTSASAGPSRLAINPAANSAPPLIAHPTASL